MSDIISYEELLEQFAKLNAEKELLKSQLDEANDTLEAIRLGEIDALVVKGTGGHQLYTLKSSDQTYRIFIEQMTEGAVTVNEEGIILYCNSQFSNLVNIPLEEITGKPFSSFIPKNKSGDFKKILAAAWNAPAKTEFAIFKHPDQEKMVLLSLKTLDLDEGISMSIIVTDMTEQKEIQRLLQLKNDELVLSQEQTSFLNSNLENTVKERTKELDENISTRIKVEVELRSES